MISTSDQLLWTTGVRKSLFERPCPKVTGQKATQQIDIKYRIIK